jgi:sporulation protein YlmC with PRC-barrel domain
MDMALDTQPSPLVSSNDVNGTTVYSREGDRIGEIDHLMIDKETGKVSYAVMSFGGFLGIGEEHYPVPWAKLHYDPRKGGFQTDISEDQVKGAPEWSGSWRDDREWERRAHDHFMVPYYWI